MNSPRSANFSAQFRCRDGTKCVATMHRCVGNFFSLLRTCVHVSRLAHLCVPHVGGALYAQTKLRAKIDSLEAAHNALPSHSSRAKKSKNRIWKWRRQRALRASCERDALAGREGTGRCSGYRRAGRHPNAAAGRRGQPLNHSLSASVVNKRLR